MLKKFSLLSVAFSILFVQTTYAQYYHKKHAIKKFNPEKIYFSKISTLKSWVAKKHYTSEKNEEGEILKSLQYLVAKTLRQNPKAYNFVFPIHNDAEVKQNYGNSLLTIEEIELPFLKFVHTISKNKNPITLEIAAGAGWVSWKVPLAFQKEGVHYANELSNEMYRYIINAQETAQNTLKSKKANLISSTIYLPGNCLSILNKHPELKNRVDAIYAANLEHFLNPVEHQKFLTLIEDLLVPGGQAFLYSDSFLFGPDAEGHSLYMLYKEREIMQDLYPGFMQYRMKWQSTENGKVIVPNAQEFLDVIHPADDSNYESKIIKAEYTNNGLVEAEALIMRNYLSPKIYHNATRLHPALQIVDTFFMDKKNNRIEEWPQVNNEPLHVATILRKRC